jgi:NitT/TauT family transport system permease protein
VSTTDEHDGRERREGGDARGGRDDRRPDPFVRRRRDRRSVNLDTVLTPRRSIGVWLYVVLAVAFFVAVFALWAIAANAHIVSERFLPPPTGVWTAFSEYLHSGHFWTDIWASTKRVLIGFAISALLAVPIGLLMGTFRAVEGLLEPFTDFVRYMPAPAFIPLLIIWVGIDERLKWAVIFIGVFFQLVLLVMDAAARVPMEMIDTAYTLGASKRQVVFGVIARATAPEIWDLLRITLGWAWTYLVVAEVVAADSGLAHSIVVAGRFLRTDLVIVGIVIIGIIGMMFDYAFKVTGRRLFPYVRRER